MIGGLNHNQNQKGFTLVELMITIVIFLFVIVAASNIFSALLGQFKQQSAIAESNIEGIVGLQMLQRDIEQAGYGLPWSLPLSIPDGTAPTYTEAGAVTSPFATNWTDRFYNDGPPYATGQPVRGTDSINSNEANPPGAIRSGNNVQNEPTVNTIVSDILVLKGANISTSQTAQAWTYINNVAGTCSISVTKSCALDNDCPLGETCVQTPVAQYLFGPVPAAASDKLNANDRIIVIRPDKGTNQRILMTDTAQFGGTGAFYTTFPSPNTTGTSPVLYNMPVFFAVASNAAFLPPQDSALTYTAYGIMPAPTAPATWVPRRPFNEAYYYVRRPATDMPSTCGPTTGILYKGVLDNTTQVALDSNGGTPSITELPLLDCVLDMQITYALDVAGNGNISYTEDINTLTASDIRNQLKEVRVFIVAHDGKFDRSYTYVNPSPVTNGVIDCTGVDKVCINDVNGMGLIKAITVPSRNYRWKVYSMIITPRNLR